VAVGGGGVWAVSYPGDVLWELDPDSGVVSTTPGHPGAVALAATKSALYPVFDGGGMEHIRPGTDQLAASVVLPDGNTINDELGDPTQVAIGPAGVWGIGGDTLYEAAPVSGLADQAMNLIKIPAIEDEEHVRGQLSGLAVGAHTLWVIGDVGDKRLWRVNVSSSSTVPRATKLGFAPSDVALGFGHVWVTGQITDKLYEINPASGRRVRVIPVGREPIGVTVGAGAGWVANAIDGTISKVDPKTGAIVTIPVGGSPADVSVGDGSVWVAADAS
jgi:streptogramin lyase